MKVAAKNIAQKSSEKRPVTTIAAVKKAIDKEAAQPIDQFLSSAPQAEIAVIDVFAKSGESTLMHGDMVKSVITRSGIAEEKVLKLDNQDDANTSAMLSDLSWNSGPEPVDQRLDAYIELSAIHLLETTNGKLNGILNSPESHIRVINQSQGKSRVDIFQLMSGYLFSAKNDEDEKEQLLPSALGQNLSKALDVKFEEPEQWGKQLRQKLINHVDQVVDNSPLVAEARQEHVELLDKLRERGVLVVTSAGNNHDEMTALEEQGFSVPEDFDDDITAVGHKFVVGAINFGDKNDPSDDKLAEFSSQYEEVNAWAQGVQVQTDAGLKNGTSFAAPILTSAAAKLVNQHPDWSTDQLEEALLADFAKAPRG